MVIFDRKDFGKAAPYAIQGMEAKATLFFSGSSGKTGVDFIMTDASAAAGENYSASKAFDGSVWVYTFGQTLEDILVRGKVPLSVCEGSAASTIGELYKKNRVSQSDKQATLSVPKLGIVFNCFLVGMDLTGVDEFGMVGFDFKLKGQLA